METAHDSYALTLWTYWHLAERERRDRIVQRSDRFDLASLVQIADRNPKALLTMHETYLRTESETPASRAERLAAAERHVAAHWRMKPIDPPAAATPSAGA